MYKLTQSMVSFFLIFFTSLAVFGQSNKDGVVTINGGTRSLFLKPPTYVTGPQVPLPQGVATIYSNLGKGKQAYNPNSGVGIVGKDAGMPLPQWVGIPFTPKQDGLVQGVQVAATYVSGTNEMAVLLDSDNHGIPGTIMHAWEISDLPQFGSCCILQTSIYATGVPVKAGTQYWIVLRTMPKGTDTYGVWDDNFLGTQGTWANNTGQGWHSSFQVLPGVGVYGK